MSDSALYALANQIVNNPSYRPLLTIVKGVRNGLVLVAITIKASKPSFFIILYFNYYKDMAVK